MKRLIQVFLMLILMSAPVYADDFKDGKDEVYFCAETGSTGYSYDESRGRHYPDTNGLSRFKMKLEYKSLLIGIIITIGGVFFIFFLLGNIKIDFTFSIGEADKIVISEKNVRDTHLILSYNIRFDNMIYIYGCQYAMKTR